MEATQIRIAVTGANGQLGQSLRHIIKEFQGLKIFFFNKKELDITKIESIEKVINQCQPNFIINTAAYTQVDRAEEEKEKAFLINEKGVVNLVSICNARDIGLIHISTDYVFDGSKDQPYLETDTTNPQGVYGASKLAGEQAIVQSQLTKYWIIRTSWLYSPYGHNFHKTMIRLAYERDELSIVNDQFGSPTNALDLASVIFEIIPKLDKTTAGVYHYSNTGVTTWYTFAKAIFESRNIDIKVKPIPTTAFPTLAKRPKFSVLNVNKLENTFSLNIQEWDDSLKNAINSFI